MRDRRVTLLLSLELDVTGCDLALKEETAHLRKLGRIFCREVSALPLPCDALCHIGMALEIVGETIGDIPPLRNDGDTLRNEMTDTVEQDGIVGTTEYEGVNARIGGEDLINVFLYEIICSWIVELKILNQRHPHRAGKARDPDIGMKLLDLQVIGMGENSAGCGKYTDVAAVGEVAYDLSCGTYDSEYAALRVPSGQVVLLDSAQGLGGSGVAGKNDKLTALPKEILNGLPGILIDHLETASAVRGARIVTEVKVVERGQLLTEALKDGKASIPGVKDAYRAWSGGQRGYISVRAWHWQSVLRRRAHWPAAWPHARRQRTPALG